MKKLVFMGTAKADIKAFPDDARSVAGHQLWRIQTGQEPYDWKPFAIAGRGVREVRIKVGGQWRIIYLANRPEAVYVLHAFQKKTQKTSKRDIDMAKKRFEEIA